MFSVLVTIVLNIVLRLNLFGSEDSKGSAVVCKFDESLQSCKFCVTRVVINKE